MRTKLRRPILVGSKAKSCIGSNSPLRQCLRCVGHPLALITWCWLCRALKSSMAGGHESRWHQAALAKSKAVGGKGIGLSSE